MLEGQLRWRGSGAGGAVVLEGHFVVMSAGGGGSTSTTAPCRRRARARGTAPHASLPGRLAPCDPGAASPSDDGTARPKGRTRNGRWTRTARPPDLGRAHPLARRWRPRPTGPCSGPRPRCRRRPPRPRPSPPCRPRRSRCPARRPRWRWPPRPRPRHPWARRPLPGRTPRAGRPRSASFAARSPATFSRRSPRRATASQAPQTPQVRPNAATAAAPTQRRAAQPGRVAARDACACSAAGKHGGRPGIVASRVVIAVSHWVAARYARTPSHVRGLRVPPPVLSQCRLSRWARRGGRGVAVRRLGQGRPRQRRCRAG